MTVIYQIINTRNSKVYIGSSKDPVTRKRIHFSMLKMQKHPNYKLQRAYNLEPQNFEFEILANTNDRFVDEESYIQLYRAVEDGYNLTFNAVLPPSRKGISPVNKLPRIQRLCDCKCGGFVTFRISNPKRFIHGHNGNRYIHGKYSKRPR